MCFRSWLTTLLMQRAGAFLHMLCLGLLARHGFHAQRKKHWPPVGELARYDGSHMHACVSICWYTPEVKYCVRCLLASHVPEHPWLTSLHIYSSLFCGSPCSEHDSVLAGHCSQNCADYLGVVSPKRQEPAPKDGQVSQANKHVLACIAKRVTSLHPLTTLSPISCSEDSVLLELSEGIKISPSIFWRMAHFASQLLLYYYVMRFAK